MIYLKQNGGAVVTTLIMIIFGMIGGWLVYQFVPPDKAIVGDLNKLVLLYGILIALIWQLWTKYNAFSEHDHLSSSEIRRLDSLVKTKRGKLQKYVIFYFLAAFFVVLASFAKEYDYIQEILITSGAILSITLATAFDMLFDWRDATEFKWKIELRAKNRDKKQATLARLHNDEHSNHFI